MKKFILILLIISIVSMGCDLLGITTDYDIYVNYPSYSAVYVDRITYGDDGKEISRIDNFYDNDGTYHYYWDGCTESSITVYLYITSATTGSYIDSGNIYLSKSSPSATYTY